MVLVKLCKNGNGGVRSPSQNVSLSAKESVEEHSTFQCTQDQISINGMLTGGGIEGKIKLKPLSIETPYSMASSHLW